MAYLGRTFSLEQMQGRVRGLASCGIIWISKVPATPFPAFGGKLLPNRRAVVRGYAYHEKSTL